MLVVGMLGLLAATGCGSSNTDGVVEAPSTAGDPAALVGTVWTNPEDQTQFAFSANGAMQMSNPAAGGVIVPGNYTVENGIISVNAGFQSIDGSWDGQKLIMNGVELTKN